MHSNCSNYKHNNNAMFKMSRSIQKLHMEPQGVGEGHLIYHH